MTLFKDERLEALAELPENMRYSYIDKFQVQQGPLNQPPYKCVGCGNHILSKEQGYVDWGFDLDYYGQVVICTDCFRQAANQLYFMDPGQVKQLVEAKSKLIRENSDLINTVTELRNALGAIGVVTSNPRVTGVPLYDEPSPVETGIEERGSVPVEPSVSRGDELAAPQAESEPLRQSAGKRSSKLSGDDTLDQLLGDSI